MAKKQSPIKPLKKAVVKKAVTPTAKKSLIRISKVKKAKTLLPPSITSSRKNAAIKGAITRHVKKWSDFVVINGNWYAGVTNDTAVRKARHQREKNIAALYFKAWNTGSSDEALSIERFLHDSGMLRKKGPGGAKETSTWIYVFKINPNMIDEIAYLLGVVS